MSRIIRGVAFPAELLLHPILAILQLVMSAQGIVTVCTAHKQPGGADHGENSDVILTVSKGFSLQVAVGFVFCRARPVNTLQE